VQYYILLLLQAKGPPEHLDANFYATINNIAFDSGYMKMVSPSNLLEAVQTMMYYHVYYKRRDIIQQIKEGFDAVIPSHFSSQRQFLREGLFPKRGDLDISLQSLLLKIEYDFEDPHVKESLEAFLTSQTSKIL
jgi:hypothetical protein